jgi:hypothetical protein
VWRNARGEWHAQGTHRKVFPSRDAAIEAFLKVRRAYAAILARAKRGTTEVNL